MSKHRFNVTLAIDDELLADHDGEQGPPPNNVSEWDFRDIALGLDMGIVDLYGEGEDGESESEYIGKV